MSKPQELKDLEKAVYEAFPNDGLYAKAIDVGDNHSVHVGIYVGGRPISLFEDRPEVGTIEMWSRNHELSAEENGERDRTLLLLQALCRFYNTGGSKVELDWYVSQIETIPSWPVLSPPGFGLVSSVLTEAGTFEHLFANPDSRYVVRWAEGQYFDILSEVQFNNQVLQSEREQANESEQSERDNRVPAGDSFTRSLPGAVQDRADPQTSPDDGKGA